MKEKDSFISIAELGFTDQSTRKLATAVEMVGFYTWDRFGRYIFVPATGEIHKDKRDRVLNDLVNGYKGIEEDSDYFYDQLQIPTNLSLSGWTKSKLPDFQALQIEWNKKHAAGITESPKHSELPPTQSKIYDALEGLIRLQFNDDFLEGLKQGSSDQILNLKTKLETVGVNIDAKTLNKYFKVKG